MQREPVQSSNIRSVGYDLPSSTLQIEFSSGAIYSYAGVPAAKFYGIRAAKSAGLYFASQIKKDYSATKIKDADKKEVTE